MNKIYFYFLPFLLLLTQAVTKQDKKKSDPQKADTPPAKLEQPAISSSVGASPTPITSLYLMLDEEFRASKRFEEQSNDTSETKQILSVAWIDEGYNKIENVGRSELISLAILTKGYAIGDTIRVTIGAQGEEGQEDEATIVDDVPCRDITFIGIQNYDNLALLKNIFTIEGKEEKMVIQPDWKERYECDAKEKQ